MTLYDYMLVIPHAHYKQLVSAAGFTSPHGNLGKNTTQKVTNVIMTGPGSQQQPSFSSVPRAAYVSSPYTSLNTGSRSAPPPVPPVAPQPPAAAPPPPSTPMLPSPPTTPPRSPSPTRSQTSDPGDRGDNDDGGDDAPGANGGPDDNGDTSDRPNGSNNAEELPSSSPESSATAPSSSPAAQQRRSAMPRRSLSSRQQQSSQTSMPRVQTNQALLRQMIRDRLAQLRGISSAPSRPATMSTPSRRSHTSQPQQSTTRNVESFRFPDSITFPPSPQRPATTAPLGITPLSLPIQPSMPVVPPAMPAALPAVPAMPALPPLASTSLPPQIVTPGAAPVVSALPAPTRQYKKDSRVERHKSSRKRRAVATVPYNVVSAQSVVARPSVQQQQVQQAHEQVRQQVATKSKHPLMAGKKRSQAESVIRRKPVPLKQRKKKVVQPHKKHVKGSRVITGKKRSQVESVIRRKSVPLKQKKKKVVQSHKKHVKGSHVVAGKKRPHTESVIRRKIIPSKQRRKISKKMSDVTEEDEYPIWK